ncbi:MAG: exodeoxyribonuclease V subunit gamma [Candidatus Dasytiphilus stammeri]
MFKLYHSNHLDIHQMLVSYYMKHMPLANPLTSEIIIVQSISMSEWLKKKFLEDLSIIANITTYSSFTDFIWDMFICVLSDIPSESFLSKENIMWKLMTILPNMDKNPECEIFNTYLSRDFDKCRLLQLAMSIAELYNIYLIYRPEWLIRWERGEWVNNISMKTQKWQACIWNKIIQYTRDLNQPILHFANLYQIFIQKIDETKKIIKGLPERVFVFSNSIPPIYLNILKALSNQLNIHFFFTNPCRYYWSDSYLPKQKDQTDKKTSFIFHLNEIPKYGNPLLASWGKIGSDSLYLLSNIDYRAEIDAFVDINPNNLLHIIQHDILELEDHSINFTKENLKFSKKKRLLNPEDQSLRIHICYNQLCEIEILQYELFKIISENPELKPSDIIVIVSDIDHYAPFIQAVFGNYSSEYYLPFSIYDINVRQKYSVIQVFLKIITICDHWDKFSSEEIINLLELPILRLKFNINDKNLSDLRSNLNELDIIWTNFNSLIISGNTNNLSDFFNINKQILDSDLVEHLIIFLTYLHKWRIFLSKSRLFIEWKPICHHLINDFFIRDVADNNTEEILIFIENQWDKILSYGIINYTERVSIKLLSNVLISCLDQKKNAPNFFDNVIHFCTMMPRRGAIPFKVVCMIGMNDEFYKFPSSSPAVVFNLMIQNPQCGDMTNRHEDRYYFLEALISARKIFYISYIIRAFQYKTELLQLGFVGEIIDYIAYSFYLPETKLLDLDISAQIVRKHLIILHTYSTSFDYLKMIKNHLLKDNNKIYKNKSYKKFTLKKVLAPIFNDIKLKDLIRFWQHPVRTFFNKRLSVYFLKKQVSDTKYFFLKNFNCYKFNTNLLNLLIKNQDPSILIDSYQPIWKNYNYFLDHFFCQQQRVMAKIVARIKPYYSSNRENKKIHITIADIQLSGYLSEVQTNGLVRWRPYRLNFKDGLFLWLEHLIYCFMNKNSNSVGKSIMFGQGNTQWCFNALSKQEATYWLTNFIKGYQNGMGNPLLLLPKTGGSWLKASYNYINSSICHEKTIQIQARQKLIQTWNEKIVGDCHDPYFQCLFHTLDESVISEIIHNAENWLLPLMQFNL